MTYGLSGVPWPIGEAEKCLTPTVASLSLAGVVGGNLEVGIQMQNPLSQTFGSGVIYVSDSLFKVAERPKLILDLACSL